MSDYDDFSLDIRGESVANGNDPKAITMVGCTVHCSTLCTDPACDTMGGICPTDTCTCGGGCTDTCSDNCETVSACRSYCGGTCRR